MVHLDKVHPNVVPLEEAVPLEGVVNLEEVPLDVVPLEEKVPLEEEVPLEVVHLDKPALSMLVESMPVQHKRKLHQMEADSPAVIVINYVCFF